MFKSFQGVDKINIGAAKYFNVFLFLYTVFG